MYWKSSQRWKKKGIGLTLRVQSVGSFSSQSGQSMTFEPFFISTGLLFSLPKSSSGYCPVGFHFEMCIHWWSTVISCRQYFSVLSGLLAGSCLNVGYSTASAHKPGRMNYMQSIRCAHEQRLPWAPPTPAPTPSREPLLYIKGIG